MTNQLDVRSRRSTSAAPEDETGAGGHPLAWRSRVPPALGWLLAATLVLGLAWALVTPAFQAPDESSHFGYLQSVAEGPGLPGDPGRPLFSTEQLVAADNSNSDQAAQQARVKMEWSSRAFQRWQAAQEELPADARSDGGGPNPAANNPPLYYLYQVPVAEAFAGGDVFDRLLALRVASLAWLLVTVAAVWLLAGEVTGRDRLLQLAAAAFAGLAPMMTFLSASVTPDAMMFALWSLVLWLGVRAIKHGLTRPNALLLLGLAGAACCVKATSYALLPGVVLVLAVGLWRSRPLRLGRAAAVVGAGLLGVALTLGVWKLVATGTDRAAAAQLDAAVSSSSTLNPRMLVSYLWQFYLPPLSFQTYTPFAGAVLPLDAVWLRGAWGAFGWLEVSFPTLVHQVLMGLTAAVVVGAGVTIWRTRRRTDWAVAAFLVLVTAGLLGGLHWTEFQQLARGGPPLNQGRYLLPLAGVAGLVLAQALRLLSPRLRAYGVATVLGVLLVLQLLAFGLTLDRFYA